MPELDEDPFINSADQRQQVADSCAETAPAPDEQAVREAITLVQAEEKPNAAVEPGTLEALARIKAANPALFAELRHMLIGLQRFDVTLGSLEKHVKAKANELGLVPDVADEKSLTDQLVGRALEAAKVFVDLEGEPHLTLYEAPRKTLLLSSRAVREWLSWLCFDAVKRSASGTVIGTVVTTLSGIARHAGAGEIPVYLRAAPSPDGNGYYVDLCDEDRRAVHVSASGWHIVEVHRSSLLSTQSSHTVSVRVWRHAPTKRTFGELTQPPRITLARGPPSSEGDA